MATKAPPSPAQSLPSNSSTPKNETQAAVPPTVSPEPVSSTPAFSPTTPLAAPGISPSSSSPSPSGSDVGSIPEGGEGNSGEDALVKGLKGVKKSVTDVLKELTEGGWSLKGSRREKSVKEGEEEPSGGNHSHETVADTGCFTSWLDDIFEGKK